MHTPIHGLKESSFTKFSASLEIGPPVVPTFGVAQSLILMDTLDAFTGHLYLVSTPSVSYVL